ncbi:MAG: hypothetical protein ABS46_15610 [Cytophagaceae bacterium SCN 52-12]|nr:MAG: hypothetical protein ABS46_15610 [Cytophagaceae bacterium SCN 52-12]
MKKDILVYVWRFFTPFLLLLFLPNVSFAFNEADKDYNSDIDPVLFYFTSDKSEVRLGEELVLTIVAMQRSSFDPRIYPWYGFDLDFRLKVVVPKGFVQTGGNYYDYIGEKLSENKRVAIYELRGKFEKDPGEGIFQLLRWGNTAKEDNKFVSRGVLKLSITGLEEDSPANKRMAQQPCGTGAVLESVSCNSISGWVFDSSEPNLALKIDIYEGNTLILGEVLADNFRQDLKDAGFGNGNHGFNITTPAILKNGQNRSVSVKVSGCTGEIWNSPQTINCPGDGGSCDFNPTVSSTNNTPSGGAQFTLNISCTGFDCSGVTYTWGGNGISGTGTTKQVTAPSSAGTYTYTVTASKPGCTDKTANINIIVPPIVPPVGITLSIWKAGNANERTKIMDLQNGDNIPISAFNGGQANWFIDISGGQISSSPGSGNYNYVSLYLNGNGYSNQGWGPENVTGAGSPPYGLHGRDGGSSPSVGTGYQLTGKVFFNGTELASKTITFNIVSAPCDFNPGITSSTTTPSANSSFTLIATCSGADCSGVTYTWGGNGISGTGTTKQVTAPSNTGTYTYTVIASKSGCTDKTASINIIVDPHNGSVQPVILTKGYPSLMDIEITGMEGNWLISDKSTKTPAQGYEWWYLVGSKLIKTSTPA